MATAEPWRKTIHPFVRFTVLLFDYSKSSTSGKPGLSSDSRTAGDRPGIVQELPADISAGPFCLPYRLHNFHHGLPGFNDLAPMIMCNSEISLVLDSSCSVSCRTWSCSTAITRSLPLVCATRGSSWCSSLPGITGSGTVTTHLNPCGVFSILPLSDPSCIRRRTVPTDTPSRSAASEILTSIPDRVLVGIPKRMTNGYASLGDFA